MPTEVHKKWAVNMVDHPEATDTSNGDNQSSPLEINQQSSIPAITRQQVEQLLKLLPKPSIEGSYNINTAMVGTSLTSSYRKTSTSTMMNN